MLNLQTAQEKDERECYPVFQRELQQLDLADRQYNEGNIEDCVDRFRADE